MSTPTQPIVVFDVETKKSFEEVGGFENLEQLGISYVGVYSTSQDKLFGFWEDDLEKLETILIAEKPLLIGFNSLHFDVPVLQPYFKRLDLLTLPHVDILKDVEKVLGHRLKLDSIAQSTLFEGKSGSGLDAIRWYREGNFDQLAQYCLDDVRVTRDIYEFGKRHGHVFYTGGGEKKPIPVQWAPEGQITITMQLQEAFKKHNQLTLHYFDVDPTGKKEVVKRTVEILDMDEKRFKAFCTELNTTATFVISQVWEVEQTGQTFAHQSSLF